MARAYMYEDSAVNGRVSDAVTKAQIPTFNLNEKWKFPKPAISGATYTVTSSESVIKLGLGPVRNGVYKKGNNTYIVNVPENAPTVPKPAPTQSPKQVKYEKQPAQNNAYALYLAKQKELSESKERQKGILSSSYNDSVSQLEQGLEGEKNEANRTSDNAQQQAYINYMMGKKDMPQNLSALGVTGGASESTMASLQNTYSGTRGKIDISRNETLAKLMASYTKQKNDAMQSYNAKLAQLESQYASLLG